MNSISLDAKPKLPPSTEVIDVLASIESPHRRVVVIKERTMCGFEQIILQQESFAPDVGWFTQSRLAMDRDQLNAMKVLLTGHSLDWASAKRPTRSYRPQDNDLNSEEEGILTFIRAS